MQGLQPAETTESLNAIVFQENNPDGFVNQVASKIIFIFERELDKQKAFEETAQFLQKSFSDEKTHPLFIDLLDLFLDGTNKEVYAALSWVALYTGEDSAQSLQGLMENVLALSVKGHRKQDRKTFKHQDSGKYFSSYSFTLGELFIQLKKEDEKFIDIIKEAFSEVLETEMRINHQETLEKERQKRSLIKKTTEDANPHRFQGKNLFDDILDYVTQRGSFKSESLNQKNPNAYIQVLADQLRSARRYGTQRMMNLFSQEKRKSLIKALKEKEATAEEVITAFEPFQKGLFLFHEAKSYNYKYLKVDRMRVLIQISLIFLGLLFLGASFFELLSFSVIGVVFSLLVMVGAKFGCTKRVFARYYPKNVVPELEENIGEISRVFKKTSSRQILSFVNKQIKETPNKNYLNLLPEYFKYIFSVIPDRKKILITQSEFNDCMLRIQQNVRKVQNGKRFEAE